MRFLFTVQPLYGHFHSMVQLALAAKAQGHAVAFATSARFGPVITRLGLEHIACGVNYDGAIDVFDTLPEVLAYRAHAPTPVHEQIFGFVQGLGLQRGAIAGSVGHDAHNVTVAGADDASMLTAVRAVQELGGGLVAALGDAVLGSVPLLSRASIATLTNSMWRARRVMPLSPSFRARAGPARQRSPCPACHIPQMPDPGICAPRQCA